MPSHDSYLIAMGPQQFNLEVFDVFQTQDPAAPIDGTRIKATVGVTINWNFNGADLPDNAVEFDAPLWQGAGPGPLKVYDNVISGGLKEAGAVNWSVVTHVLKKVEPDMANKRFRWAVTPVVQLVRHYVPLDGSPPDTQVAYTASDTARGDWQPMP